MSENLRQRTFARAGCCFGAAAVVLLNPGYLPRIGPAPLRVCDLHPHSTNFLIRPEPPPKPPVPLIETPAPTPQKAESVPAPAPPAPPVVAVTNSPAASPPADPVISPEMFLKYFDATKASPGSAPLDFTPPQPGAVPATGGNSTSPP